MMIYRSNFELRRAEDELVSQRKSFGEMLVSEKNPHIRAALQICIDSIQDEIIDLPLPDHAEDEYYEEMYYAHRHSLPRLTLKEEVEVFEAQDIIKRLLGDARRVGDFKLEARMNQYFAALKELPSARLTDDQIQRAREFPVRQLLEGYGKRVSAHGFCPCPIHNEKTGSFKVYKDNSWRCFGCGEYGDAIALVMKVQGLSFQQAVRELQ